MTDLILRCVQNCYDKVLEELLSPFNSIELISYLFQDHSEKVLYREDMLLC
ncbi:uncharacterized protein BJ212DRAFT_1397248 [Suillus subaureus]|uniref:Uncharacterized protein n=1 Tax=Suillus subaureus TaxID=48587 RepID=A0A9P7DU62_9AGAM|nr:uncharacterized protein BJ212DRAFT_1397248 [Suillus subaureus]KAG1802981.1 hypothetical protein BJ212DRAFT_1397248 [Suillus subaureus]